MIMDLAVIAAELNISGKGIGHRGDGAVPGQRQQENATVIQAEIPPADFLKAEPETPRKRVMRTCSEASAA